MKTYETSLCILVPTAVHKYKKVNLLCIFFVLENIYVMYVYVMYVVNDVVGYLGRGELWYE